MWISSGNRVKAESKITGFKPATTSSQISGYDLQPHALKASLTKPTWLGESHLWKEYRKLKIKWEKARAYKFSLFIRGQRFHGFLKNHFQTHCCEPSKGLFSKLTEAFYQKEPDQKLSTCSDHTHKDRKDTLLHYHVFAWRSQGSIEGGGKLCLSAQAPKTARTPPLKKSSITSL